MGVHCEICLSQRSVFLRWRQGFFSALESLVKINSRSTQTGERANGSGACPARCVERLRLIAAESLAIGLVIGSSPTDTFPYQCY